MKKLIIILALLVTSYCNAQLNMVGNPSFEQFDTCPSYSGQTRYASGWTININSADYFNSCDTLFNQILVPKNFAGYQVPDSGNAYFGFFAWNPFSIGSKEFFGRKLSENTIIGQKYFISFKISLACGDPLVNPPIMCGIDKIGLKFTNINTSAIPIPLLNPYFSNNNAHVLSTQIVKDTLNWTNISGSFVADSMYQYFLIGNFFDSVNTNFSCLDSNNVSNRWAYYYIDNICISADSLNCNPPNGINSIERILLLDVFPNPFNYSTEIKIPEEFQYEKAEITLSDLFGRVIWRKSEFIPDKISFFKNELTAGFYVFKIQFKNKIFSIKLILTN